MFVSYDFNLHLCTYLLFSMHFISSICNHFLLAWSTSLSLDCEEIKPVNPKGNQPWIFIGRNDAEAPILWPHDVKSLLIGKDPDAREDSGQKGKETAENEMVR